MDPVITKVATEAVPLKEGGGKVGGGGENFQKLLQEQMNKSDESTRMVLQSFNFEGPASTLKVIPANSVALDPSKLGLNKQTDLLHTLNEVNRGALQMDQMIEMVTSGQSFTPQELLAMQSGIYQVVMEVDLTGQVVSSADRARNSLLNIQI